MIIRESPVSKKSGSETNWPPKSPREALLSSPSRRKRLQQTRRDDLSPTPTKRRRLGDSDVEDENGTDIEEDEEALRLELKEIEIRRKLKKIHDAKRRACRGAQDGQNSVTAKDEAAVEISLSPKRDPIVQRLPVSPRRVQLGIDKGLKAADVSLKKFRSNRASINDPLESKAVAKSTSFSERLAGLKAGDKEKDEKQRRVQIARSKGFGVQKAAMTRGSATDTSRPNVSAQTAATVPPKASERDEQRSREQDQHHTFAESNTVVETYSGFALSKQTLDVTVLSGALAGKTVVSIPQLLKDVTSPDYDLPDFPTEDFVVTGIIASKSLPRDQQKSSSTKGTKDDASDAPAAKFMAVTLTDLQWSLDLYLFDSGFSRFWKLTVGTVIAILNPGIMPPKPHMRDTGRFSLKLSSSEDTVLEIGMSQNLGFCSSMKKDGKQCGQWIDKRKTEFCDFHVNLAIEKTTSKRMEINGMSAMGLFGTEKSGAGKGRGFGASGQWKRGRGDNNPKREGQYYDRHLGETAYLLPAGFSGNRNTAKLLDAEDYMQGALSSKERSRKRLADRERERDLSQKLAEAGGGLGGEYMRVKGKANGTDPTNASKYATQHTDTEEKKNAAGLGLVGASAAEVTLSPVKARRARTGEGAQPMGWSGAFTRGLLSPSRKETKAPLGGGVIERQSGNASRARSNQVTSSTAIEESAAPNSTTNDEDDDGLDIV